MNTDLIGLLFLVGLMGSGHCLAMCGGLSSALGLSTKGSQQKLLFLLFIAQLARLTSYGFIGALFGSSIELTQDLFALKNQLIWLRLFANFMLIGMGLYIAGWWFGLKRLEALAAPIWRKIQPIQGRFLPMQTPLDALVIGFCWGWLPCGLVYSALVTSVSSANPLQAALGMMAFGLGTLPSVWLAGSAGSWLRESLQNRVFKITTGLLLITYGLNQLIQILKIIF